MIKKPRDNAEEQLQRVFFRWYNNGALPGVVAYHVRNERSKNMTQGRIFKDLGVLAGVHDIVLEWPWRNKATIELKSPNKRPSENKYSETQQGYAEAMDRVGFPHACCQNGQQIMAALLSFGIKPAYNFPAGW